MIEIQHQPGVIRSGTCIGWRVDPSETEKVVPIGGQPREQYTITSGGVVCDSLNPITGMCSLAFKLHMEKIRIDPYKTPPDDAALVPVPCPVLAKFRQR